MKKLMKFLITATGIVTANSIYTYNQIKKYKTYDYNEFIVDEVKDDKKYINSVYDYADYIDDAIMQQDIKIKQLLIQITDEAFMLHYKVNHKVDTSKINTKYHSIHSDRYKLLIYVKRDQLNL